MALGNCLTMSLNGVLAQLVEVEANVGHGLPGIHVVVKSWVVVYLFFESGVSFMAVV